MSNEWRVATLEQAQRLLELGIKLETEKVWFKISDEKWVLRLWENLVPESGVYDPKDIVPAPDTSELGKVLPVSITTDINDISGINIPDMWFIRMSITPDKYWVAYAKIGGLKSFHCIGGNTEAEVRCDMYIWLIENEYIN